MNARYRPAWVKLGTVNGKIFGVAAKANSKSVVWYRPDQFRKYKLKPAKTWTQLVQITKKLKAKGQDPCALGAKDSWTLTGWFENIYARWAGPDRYTRLFTGKLKFTDRSVRTTLRYMTQILNNKYVVGGVRGSLGTSFVDGIGRVFGSSAKAQLYMEGGFVGGIATQQVNTNLKPGKTINFFPFPTIRKKYDGAIVSPNKQVKASAYPNVLVRAEAKQVSTAKTFRFDGSDLLPGDLANEWGATLQSIVQNPKNMNDLLSEFQKKADKEF